MILVLTEEPVMVILFNFKRRRYFGYTWLLVRMTRKQDFLKALSEIRSKTPLSLIDYGSKYVRLLAAGTAWRPSCARFEYLFVRHDGSVFYCLVSLASMAWYYPWCVMYTSPRKQVLQVASPS